MPKKRTRRTVESRLRTELTICKDAYQRQTIHMEQLQEEIRQHTETWAHRNRELKDAEKRLLEHYSLLNQAREERDVALSNYEAATKVLAGRDKEISALLDKLTSALTQHTEYDLQLSAEREMKDELQKRLTILMKAYSHLSRAHDALMSFHSGAMVTIQAPK